MCIDIATILFCQGHIPFRLSNGDHGLLEVYRNGRWGTVCYNYQRLDSLCNELGYGRYVFIV